VQAIPTPTTPTVYGTTRGSARKNTSLIVTDSVKNHQSVKTRLALKTNFTSPVSDFSGTSSVSVVKNTNNGPQNLASYSLDPPNSFPQPTSIPAIDTLSASWPTPMGSIYNEMNDIENPPTMQPIGNEMSSEEKIPGIENISSVEPIPLSFEEESPWERSHATSSNVISGHANLGHTSHESGNPHASGEKLRLVKSRNATTSNARRRENIVVNPRNFSKGRNILHSTKLTAFKFGRQNKTKSNAKYNLQHKAWQQANKRKSTGKALNPCSLKNTKKSRKRVSIPPPKPIDPIQPLLEKFQKEKTVGDIKEHTLDIETVKPSETIDKHLVSIESQPEIGPIKEHLSKDKPAAIEPIANHQLDTNAK